MLGYALRLVQINHDVVKALRHLIMIACINAVIILTVESILTAGKYFTCQNFDALLGMNIAVRASVILFTSSSVTLSIVLCLVDLLVAWHTSLQCAKLA